MLEHNRLPVSLLTLLLLFATSALASPYTIVDTRQEITIPSPNNNEILSRPSTSD